MEIFVLTVAWLCVVVVLFGIIDLAGSVQSRRRGNIDPDSELRARPVNK